MAKRRRTKVQRIIRFIRKFIAFLFSHVGLCALIVGYTVAGAFLFKALEREQERQIQETVLSWRAQTIEKMWHDSYELNILFQTNWSLSALSHTEKYKTVLVKSIKKGYDGKGDKPQWTFPGAFLYSLTVITTIGKLSPRSDRINNR